MPGLPAYDPLDPTANLIRKRGLSVAMVDAFGRSARVRISNLGAQDLAVGEKSRFTQAVGEASNMGAFGWTEERTNFRLTSDAEVFDETYADATTVLYLVYQNNEGNTIPFEIPAPQARLFGPDGVTLLEPAATPGEDSAEQAIVRELLDAAQNVINTSFLPVNSYVLKVAYRTSRKVKLPRPGAAKPVIVEPATSTGTST